MSMPIALPFGIRDIKVIPYTDMTATVLDDTMVDFPYARTLSFTESEDFEDLRGDDQLVTSHGSGAWIEFEIEGGGISLEALAVLNGGTVTASGIAPNRTKRYRKRITDVKPWFCIIGQSVSDSGGDLHTIIYRAKITDNIEGEFADQEFFMPTASGKGYGSWRPGLEYGTLYDFLQQETITAITIPLPPVNEIERVTITGAPTGGTFTLTFNGQTTAGIAYNAAASAVQAALEALSNIGVGDVACTGGPLPGTAVDVEFTGALAGTNVTQMTATPSLTGGTSPAVTVTTITQGG
ncbi:MAG: fibronectin type III domain-containing protein [Nitrospira sp.]